MKTFTDLFLRENLGQLILSVLFIIYLILGAKLPGALANVVDTIYGKVIVIVLAIILFIHSNPILGILGFIVAFEMIRQSGISTGSNALEKYMPTEKKRITNMNAMNQFPYTLEQEIVKKMAPLNQSSDPPEKDESSFHPILDNLHDAAPLNYSGIV
jgi:hypothetical protein